jgi:hypothetical protein
MQPPSSLASEPSTEVLHALVLLPASIPDRKRRREIDYPNRAHSAVAPVSGRSELFSRVEKNLVMPATGSLILGSLPGLLAATRGGFGRHDPSHYWS